MQLLTTAGCETDTRPIQRAFGTLSLPRHTFTVVLDGEYESEAVGRASASQVAYEVRSAWMERWSGPAQRFLAVTWEDGANDSAGGVDPIGAAGLARWRAIAERIGRVTEEEADSVAAEVLDAVRATGVRPPSLSYTPVPVPIRRMGDALNHVFTHLHEMPQWLDLEAHAQLGARHLRRVLAAHPGWLPYGSWRKALLRYRLSLATSLLGAPGATVSEVAAALGYRSDRALHTALRRAGLSRRA